MNKVLNYPNKVQDQGSCAVVILELHGSIPIIQASRHISQFDWVTLFGMKEGERLESVGSQSYVYRPFRCLHINLEVT